MDTPSYRGFRFPPEVIPHCVCLYYRFNLSLRDVEELMLERGIEVTHETIHQWTRRLRSRFTPAPPAVRQQVALRRDLREDQRYAEVPVAGRGRRAYVLDVLLLLQNRRDEAAKTPPRRSAASLYDAAKTKAVHHPSTVKAGRMNSPAIKKGEYSIIAGKFDDPQLSPVLLDGMFALRYEVFHNRLGWEVESVDGQERDSFDSLNPTYVIAYEPHTMEVEGCLRLLPTMGPHMLSEVFANALKDEKQIRDPYVWESSRFAVRPGINSSSASVGEMAVALLGTAGTVARQAGIHSIITLTNLKLEHQGKSAGIVAHRLGPPTEIGNVTSVALAMPVSSLTPLDPSQRS